MVYKIDGVTKDYIWGGQRLRGYGYPGERIAEAWVLSFHPDGMSTTDGAPVSTALPRESWGENCRAFEQFPVLIKLIDAADNLSVQVHPSDDYALRHEGQYGKTEMWYVVEAAAGAGLYVGFKQDMTAEAVKAHIAAGTLTDALNFFPVRPGDCFFIPSGTVHAIGKGCLIAEVQQNSNLTYRVYDYGRVGADGKPRALHVDKALAVMDLGKYAPSKQGDLLAQCRYFTVRLATGTVGSDKTFTSILFIGDGTIDGKAAKKGESYFVPAGSRAQIEGKAVVTTVEAI